MKWRLAKNPPNRKGFYLTYHNGNIRMFYFDSLFWRGDDDNTLEGVTHWMPIPKAPKE